MMRLFLQDGPARLQILSRSHVREMRDVGAAREFLRPMLAQPGNRATARRTLMAEPTFASGTAWSDADLLEHLARRMVQDGLLIVSCADSYLAALQGTFESAAGAAAAAGSQTQPQTTPLQDEEAAKEEKGTQEPEEQHWIEIELLDDDGKPVAAELYYVELPDGSQLSGRTDGQGRARVDGVDPGTAKVSFPDLDKKMYEPGGGG
jgi:hypothetical protein